MTDPLWPRYNGTRENGSFGIARVRHGGGGASSSSLRANAEYLASRTGAPLEVARVLVRRSEKDRVPELDRALVTTKADEVLKDPSIDTSLIEVMGGGGSHARLR